MTIDDTQIRLVRESLPGIRELLVPASMDFYDNLFALAPELRALFRSDIASQGMRFMIEAMACGTPVIAFPCGSVPEVIDQGVTGFIVRSVEEAVAAVPAAAALNLGAGARDLRVAFYDRTGSRRPPSGLPVALRTGPTAQPARGAPALRLTGAHELAPQRRSNSGQVNRHASALGFLRQSPDHVGARPAGAWRRRVRRPPPSLTLIIRIPAERRSPGPSAISKQARGRVDWPSSHGPPRSGVLCKRSWPPG